MTTRGSRHRTFRGLSDQDWEDLEEATKGRGTDRSTVIRDFIRYYLRRPGAKLPKRPDATATNEPAQDNTQTGPENTQKDHAQ